MAKGAFLMIRAAQDFKARLEEAARRKGQSMTTFALDALEKEIRRVEAAPPASRHLRGVPTYFRAACSTASHGGAQGYRDVGRKFADSMPGELKAQGESGEPEHKLKELQARLDAKDFGGALAWFDREFPKFMALVPRAKRRQFTEGLYERHREKGPWF